MLLVVDVGNTQTHFGTFGEEDRLVEHWRFATVRDVDRRRARRGAAQPARPARARRSPTSTRRSSPARSRSLEPEWLAMAERYLDHGMLRVGPGLRTGMAIRYDNPREIGADRLVNAVAIRERFGGPAICVDFGTAVNFDVVSRRRRVPRRRDRAGRRDLARGADRARREAAEDRPRRRRGRSSASRPSTRSARASSTATPARSTASSRRIRGRARASRTRSRSPRAAWRGHIVPFSEEISEVDQLLTLTGLRLVYERNAPPD